MKKHNNLPEQELSDFTIDDVLNGNLELNGFFLEKEELDDDALEEDLILGDETELDEEDDVEYEIEFDDDGDEDDDLDEDDDDLDEEDIDLDEDDLILDVDEDDEDLDVEEDPDEDLGG